jgi:hypothetical protein
MAEEIAKWIKTKVQWIIGLVILLTIIAKSILIILKGFVASHDWFPLKPISPLAEFGMLELVGGALAFSASMDLAYMLYTEGPDEAVEPVILGVAATILILISATEPKDLGWHTALAVLLLAITIALLFYIREVYILRQQSGRSRRRRRRARWT